MFRRTALLTLCLVPLAAGFLAADDRTKIDIRCEAKGEYIGNLISPVFSLSISGPKEKTWSYRFSDNQSGTLKEPIVREIKGTYELADGLAIITGTGITRGGDEPRKEEPVRFGVNYGFPGGEVHFNRLFPAGDGTLRYRRQWFTRSGKGWTPAEERTLSLPLKGLEQGKKVWEVTVKGERARWDRDGKKTVERAE